MNVAQRINSRKIVLSYCYQYCFFLNLKKNDNILKEILFIDGVFLSSDNFEEKKQSLIKQMSDYIDDNVDEDLSYFFGTFFDKWTDNDVDMEYIFGIGTKLKYYHNELIDLVNKHTVTFSYDKMDTMDQAIFLLGYVEWKVLGTERKILLNELVELSKRFADDGSSKLVNGIMHNILSELDK